MNQEITFSYNYSAKTDKEVQEIREKYLPHEESKFEELKRLDHTVQNAGMIESLCIGIGGALVFGLGICLVMQWIGTGTLLMMLGALLGMIGMMGMTISYPVYCRVFDKTKKKFTPKILELAAELSSENN